VLSAIVILFVAIALLAPPWPPFPPLLRNADSRGGYGSACPAESEGGRAWQAKNLAVSPQVEQRLRNQFPPGTPEHSLVTALSAQGFTMLPPCETDASVHRADFVQKGGSLLWFSGTGEVFWKVDGDGKIVWTHGMVSYDAL
jgi:hypothetical protein